MTKEEILSDIQELYINTIVECNGISNTSKIRNIKGDLVEKLSIRLITLICEAHDLYSDEFFYPFCNHA